MRKTAHTLGLVLLVAAGSATGQAAERNRETCEGKNPLRSLELGARSAVARAATRGRGPRTASRPAPFPSPGTNVQVNDPQAAYPDGFAGRCEPTIASDESGTRLLAGWVDFQGVCGLFLDCAPPPSPGFTGFAFSTDAGRTWTDGGSPPILDDAFTLLDPWADRGGKDKRTFYLSTNSLDATTLSIPGVNVFRAHLDEGGLRWDDVHQLRPSNPDDLFDRDVIAMAKDGSGRGYLSVSNFIGECGQFAFGWGQIQVWRTGDGGDSWQGPVIVSPDVTFVTDPGDPTCGLSGINQQGAQPVIGPGGEVYVVWRYGPRQDLDSASPRVAIRISRSLDFGEHFAPPVTIVEKNTVLDDPPVGFSNGGLPDHPRPAVATVGPHKGRVYVTYAAAQVPVSPAALFPCPDPFAGTTCQEQSLTSTQVFLTFSDDKAATWSVPVPVAPAVPGSALKRFYPVVVVAPGGDVEVVYQESRETAVAENPFCAAFLPDGTIRYGAANSLVDTFAARSTDGGLTFAPPRRISTETSNWCTTYCDANKNFGDYISATVTGDRLLATWTDGRNGVPDVFVATVPH